MVRCLIRREAGGSGDTPEHFFPRAEAKRQLKIFPDLYGKMIRKCYKSGNHMQTLYRSLLWLAGLVLLVACGSPYQYNGSEINPPKPLPDFTLTDHYGQPFQLSAQRGITLLYFGYTNCPDFCPATMGAWKQLKQHLGTAADEVQFVFVTVDPERDTPEVLQSYLANFDKSFLGLRPTRDQLAELSRGYMFPNPVPHASEHADHGNDATTAESINHVSRVYVVDPHQQLRLLFRPDDEPEAMAADIKALLRLPRS
jgi:protein SCO1/2